MACTSSSARSNGMHHCGSSTLEAQPPPSHLAGRRSRKFQFNQKQEREANFQNGAIARFPRSLPRFFKESCILKHLSIHLIQYMAAANTQCCAHTYIRFITACGTPRRELVGGCNYVLIGIRYDIGHKQQCCHTRTNTG